MYDPRPPLTFSPYEASSPAGPAPPEPEPKKLGRPRVLDEVKKREILALVAAGAGIARASKYVGCSDETIANEKRRDPVFAENLRRAEAQAEMEPINLIRQKASTHWRAAAFLLNKLSDDQKKAIMSGEFKQQCLRDFRLAFLQGLHEVIPEIDQRHRVKNTFMACYCNFTRELARMLPFVEIDFGTQEEWEKKLKAKGFLE
jgi:hypothetical protein